MHLTDLGFLKCQHRRVTGTTTHTCCGHVPVYECTHPESQTKLASPYDCLSCPIFYPNKNNYLTVLAPNDSTQSVKRISKTLIANLRKEGAQSFILRYSGLGMWKHDDNTFVEYRFGTYYFCTKGFQMPLGNWPIGEFQFGTITLTIYEMLV